MVHVEVRHQQLCYKGATIKYYVGLGLGMIMPESEGGDKLKKTGQETEPRLESYCLLARGERERVKPK